MAYIGKNPRNLYKNSDIILKKIILFENKNQEIAYDWLLNLLLNLNSKGNYNVIEYQKANIKYGRFLTDFENEYLNKKVLNNTFRIFSFGWL